MSNDILKDTTRATLPWEKIISVSKTVVVDSRQRDCSRYKSSSHYTLNLGDTFKNISALELKGALIPKSSYNVHSSNNKIDFAIGDFVSGFRIENGGAGYTSAPTVTIYDPENPGVTATATAIINTRGSITNIIINNAGSGYIPSRPPYMAITPPTNKKQLVIPKITVIIGIHYTATLRVGEYEIGGNPVAPLLVPTNLLLEIQNSMNYAVNMGSYNPTSSSPFAVRLVSQYPELDATAGTPESFDTNCCKFNRIQIININSEVWEFLWCSGPNEVETSASILGFNTVDTGIGISVPEISTMGNVIIPAGTAIRGQFDYNLNNDPDYVVLSIGTGDRNLDRITSLDDGIDHRFCVLLFDNNNPETLHDMSGSFSNVGGVDYLQGPTTKGLFYRAPGPIKSIKANDFDGAGKKIIFDPPMGKISTITISFTKFGYRPGSTPQYYNMEGREHLLLFELTASDNKSQMKN